MREAALSVSSTSSISSSHERKIASPRKHQLTSPSPPLSPSLPSLLYRHGSKDRKRRRLSTLESLKRFAFAGLCAVSACYLLFKVVCWFCAPHHQPGYYLVDRSHLPEDPTALIVHDDRGKRKWTVWVPPQSTFPLRPWEYQEICAQADDLRKDLKRGRASFLGMKSGYYGVDRTFIEVDAAVSGGMLPNSAAHIPDDDTDHRKVCKKSLTFVMETDDVSMGNSMLALWLAYGLAQTESRAFFVDDSRWVYGNYSTYFKSPPEQDCRPPPENQIVPCPRNADHLVISQATFSRTFGQSFLKEFVDTSKPVKQQHHRIYQLIRDGYEALFRLADNQDAKYIRLRTTGRPFKTAKDGGGMSIGIHIRRGDLHPWTQEFQGDYLPLSRYMDEVRSILSVTYGSDHNYDPFSDHHDPISIESSSHSSNLLDAIKHKAQSASSVKSNLLSRLRPAALHNTALLLSSDDPTLYTNHDLRTCIRSQDRIHLADKAALQRLGAKKKGVLDTVNGWEGGFYRDIFLALGQKDEKTRKPPPRPRYFGGNIRSSQSEHYFDAVRVAGPVAGKPFHDPLMPHQVHNGHGFHHGSDLSVASTGALALRTMIGRAYLLDLAVLGKSDAVVCAVSSAACRVLGVMMGWEAVKDGLWRDIDGGHGWVGVPGLKS